MTHGGIVYAMLIAQAERMKSAAHSEYAFEMRDALLEAHGCKGTRLAHGISTKELAGKANLGESVISRFENGSAELTRAQWEAIGNALCDCIRERAFTQFWESPSNLVN